MEELDGMSWRRFFVLVTGLSVNSITVSVKSNGEEKEEIISDPKAGERAFKSIL